MSDILENEKVKKLDFNEQHLGTSRLSHSLNVSYYSFLICKYFNLDYKAAARGGLLHDMFFYNYKEMELSPLKHSYIHSQIAIKNAKRNFEINILEQDIIEKHMWPMTIKAPRYMESYIVSFSDKYCTILEVFSKLFKKLKLRYSAE